MIDYRTPLNDILFALEHGAEVARLKDWDRATAVEVLTHASRFVDEVLAPLDPVGDAEGCRLENGQVRLPPSFRKAYDVFCEGGWPGLAIPEEYGGQGLPDVLAAALSEMMSGACISYEMVLILAQAAMRTLLVNASPEQKKTYIPMLASGEWLATMAMTEPQAGSDLSLVRTSAKPIGGDKWAISGNKIFISGGDSDYTDGKILHLVLARTGEMELGVKGLSLFLCRSHHPDGRRNGISVLRIEEKMGMHASPTCQLAFDQAEAEMIGKPGEGLARMFTMMNLQRLEVALEAIGLCDVAGQRARAYAAERKQGKISGAKGPQPIALHDDVRRMLTEQLALAMGTRALTYRAMTELNLDPTSPLVDFLTPLTKAFCSEAIMQCAQHAIQIHGGYGFLREYRVEQILRDGRITLIYEGTNGIQAATLAGRLLQINGGAAAQAFAADVERALATCGENSALESAFTDWKKATASVRGMDQVGAVADSYMRLSGLVAFGSVWARLEAAADHAPNPEQVRATGAYVRKAMLPASALYAQRCLDPAPVATFV